MKAGCAGCLVSSVSQRIVACQGPIQLVTAVAVLRQRDLESPEGDETKGVSWNDYLVIMDLATPVTQEIAFVKVLEQMARALRPWKSVVHVKQPGLGESNSLGYRISAIEGLIGQNLDDVREVYVVREWQAGNQLLFKAFPSATKICFGDSIGIYLAPTYMTPRVGILRSLVRRLKAAFMADYENKRAPREIEFPRVPADCYYLTLPKAFDPVPSANIRSTNVALLQQVITDLIPLLPDAVLSHLKPLLDGRRLVVVVGSNFSEQGLMTPHAEISAYVEYLSEQNLDSNSLVLLKPHPRDRVEKLRELEIALSRIFQSVFTLSDDIGFFLPLETLLMNIRSFESMHGNIDVCTFSSACLASKYILDITPRIGFGGRLVRKHFKASFVEARLNHERQLLKACGQPI